MFTQKSGPYVFHKTSESNRGLWFYATSYMGSSVMQPQRLVFGLSRVEGNEKMYQNSEWVTPGHQSELMQQTLWFTFDGIDKA